MLFSSIPFLYRFLPVVLLLYFAAPRRLKNTVLLCSSLFFYAWGEPKFLLFMLLSVALGYVCGLLLGAVSGRTGRRAVLFVCVFACLGLLGFCKYADFFIGSFNALTGLSVPLLGIALPIGISFYTFQVLSYAADVYRGDVPPQKNPIDFAMYITMFPQLIAGPIVRYREIAPALKERRHSIGLCAAGAQRFLIGLGKKVILADSLAALSAAAWGAAAQSILSAWLGAVSFALQIYFDFSGYSDMAIGLGKLFGFSFSENFRYPYIAASITDFWRRWHISLSAWFCDYLYIPLGGNRVPRWRWLLNLVIVWGATGFWHGAAWNFILWGLYFAVLLILEKLFLLRVLQKQKILNHAYVLLAVLLGFVLFDGSSASDGFAKLSALFGGGGLPLWNTESLFLLRDGAAALLFGALGATPLCAHLWARFSKSRCGARVGFALQCLFSAAVLIVCTAYLVSGSYSPFLYFRF